VGKPTLWALPLLVALWGCHEEPFSGYCGAGPSGMVPLRLDLADVHQRIEGIGASTAFLSDALTDDEADAFFSPSRGIGLSLLRLRVGEDGGLGGGEWSDAARAAARGARVWATPWSAPGEWKDNDDVDHGGRLCAGAGQGRCSGARYEDWAERLAGFGARLEAHTGVSLFAISLQNEPDMTADYASMRMSPREVAALAKAVGRRLAWQRRRPRLIVGEYGAWSGLPALVAEVQADPEALAAVDVFAAHQYQGIVAMDPPPKRAVWETEFSRFNDVFDPSVQNAVVTAHAMNDAFLHADAATWHYWWLRNPVSYDNQGLLGHAGDLMAPTKRLFAVGNFSRFVRPGWDRVGVQGGGPGLVASAYRDPGSGAFALVVENCSSTGDATVDLDVSGAGVDVVEVWVTSGTPLDTLGSDGNLSQGSPSAGLPARLAAPGGRVWARIPYGVVTFVGRP
jgi:glucuronoarabinoxylan endo-1,4-beta-xylanase